MERPTEGRLAVVVPSRDRPELLRAALAAIATAVPAGTEVLVADSASAGPGTAATARAAGARLVRCERPGASRARNAGWAATQAEIVAFTDDDCRPEPGWGQALLAAFADPDVGFVTGRVDADTTEGVPLSVQPDAAPRAFRRGDDLALMGHGANLAVRRSALVAVGGFDEVLGAGAPLRAAEDKDLLRRLLDAGWTGRYAPDARVVHAQWRTRRAALAMTHAYGVGSGAMARKTRGLLWPALWQHGLRQSWRDLRSGYQLGAVAGLLHAAGVLRGALRAGRWRVMDGRFVPRD